MNRYKVTLTNVELVIEVDAPNEAAARGALYNAFKNDRSMDPLAGCRFTFDKTQPHERECGSPRLMTTTVPGMRDIEVEEIP